jgi:hypothetical protein
MNNNIVDKIINDVAEMRYEPLETTEPGPIHTYGQIP